MKNNVSRVGYNETTYVMSLLYKFEICDVLVRHFLGM